MISACIKRTAAIAFFASSVFAAYSQSQLNSVAAQVSSSAMISSQNEIISSRGERGLVPNPQLAMSSSDYYVTAGDIYTLAFAVGSTPVTYTISVDTSYKVRVANLAVLDGAGKTFTQLKRQVEEIVTKNYPLSGVQFVLMTPSVFKVTVVGEVRETSISEAWALSRLSTVIRENMTEYSSKRKVTVTSASGQSKDYDLFLAERFGDLSQDPYLRPGDTVTVNRLDRKVSINGGVERPGTYELLESDNIKRLVEYYGGNFTDYANRNRVEITRYHAENNMFEKLYLDSSSYGSDFKLHNHDSVFIQTSDALKPVMFFEGAVGVELADEDIGTSRKVTLRFEEGTNYTFWIRKNAKLFTEISDLSASYILRGGKKIPVDVSKVLYDQTYSADEVVMSYDTFVVPFRQLFVNVAGAVVKPGRYPYIPDRTYDYYIGLAGGFVNEKNAFNACSLVDKDRGKHKKSETVQPEWTITAKANSFTYYFGVVAPVFTTILSIATSALTIYTLTN